MKQKIYYQTLTCLSTPYPRLICRRGKTNRRRGFTLVELLVVLGIIVLLISILIPTLRHAREQARIGRCLANLRSLAQVGTAYLLDYDDLPWVLPAGFTAEGTTFTNTIFSEYIYGGGMPAATDELFREIGSPSRTVPSQTDVYHIPPKFRPLNPYFEATVSWNADPTNPPAQERTDEPVIPAFFQCPSDRNPYVPMVGELNPPPNDDEMYSCWWFWGTSYPINWYWPYYFTAAPPGGAGPYTQFDAVIGIRPEKAGMGSILLLQKTGAFASEFIMFYENQLNFALEAAKPPGHKGGPWASETKSLRGWHGEQDHHIAAFLDGSARYQRFDTRFVFGDKWTIWPGQPWGGAWQEYNDLLPK